MQEKAIKWKLPKKKQPIWRVFKFITNPIFRVKNVEFLGEKFPTKCIIVANHNNKKGPMVYEFSLPVKHVTWGAYQMLGSYGMRFRYLRDVLYIQKNGVKKWKATLKAMIEAVFSLRTYRGMKVLPTFPDARIKRTLKYSMECLDADFPLLIFPEDSNKGYFDEMTHFYSGFVLLSELYFKNKGEDLPVFPVYFGRKKKKIVVGKPLYVQDLIKKGLNRDEIAEVFRLEVNKLYNDYFKE